MSRDTKKEIDQAVKRVPEDCQLGKGENVKIQIEFFANKGGKNGK